MRLPWQTKIIDQKPAEAVTGFSGHGVIINASDRMAIDHAKYRADALARDIEQRRTEGSQRTDHSEAVAQALAHAYALLAAGEWTEDEVDSLSARLKGKATKDGAER